MKKIKIAYSDYDVISVKHEVEDLEAFAEFLVNKVPTLENAKYYVTAMATDMKTEWGVEGYGEEMFWAPRQRPKLVCEQDALFIHMKGKWHVTEDGCDWDPVADYYDLREVA